MAKCFRQICPEIVLTGLLFMVASACADDGKELFVKQCAGCHTIGGGEDGGPDLKGVTSKRGDAWLVRVIVEPDKLTAEKDAIQEGLIKKYGYEMPNLGVSRDDAKKIIAYLKKSGGGGDVQGKAVKAPLKSGVTEPPAEVPAAATMETTPAKPVELVVTPELIAAGRALFVGEKRLGRGGAPCASCHGFGYQGVVSGNLAADLSGIYEKMGEQGVRGVLKSLKFPTMKKIYADRALTDEEIVAIIAFVKDGSSRKAPVTGGMFPLAGAGLLICAVVVLSIYKRRIG